MPKRLDKERKRNEKREHFEYTSFLQNPLFPGFYIATGQPSLPTNFAIPVDSVISLFRPTHPGELPNGKRQVNTELALPVEAARDIPAESLLQLQARFLNLQQKFVVVEVERPAGLESGGLQAADLFESEFRAERGTRHVAGCDETEKRPVSTPAAFLDHPLHECAPDALSGAGRREIEREFHASLVRGSLPEPVRIAVAVHAAAALVHEIRPLRRDFLYAPPHLFPAQRLRLEGDGSRQDVVVVYFRQRCSVFGGCRPYHNNKVFLSVKII